MASDVIMPGMNESIWHHIIRERYPDLAVVRSSGSTMCWLKMRLAASAHSRALVGRAAVANSRKAISRQRSTG